MVCFLGRVDRSAPFAQKPAVGDDPFNPGVASPMYVRDGERKSSRPKLIPRKETDSVIGDPSTFHAGSSIFYNCHINIVQNSVCLLLVFEKYFCVFAGFGNT